MGDGLEVAQRGRVREDDPPSAARSSVPSARRRPSPNRATIASSAGSPGSTTSRATWSASMTTTPGRSPSQPATVDLPQPIGPVSPIRTVTARRSSSSSHASSAAASATSISASSLVTRRSSTKFALHRRIAHRQLEVVLPQPKPRQLPLSSTLLPPIRLLRELLLLPLLSGRRWGRLPGCLWSPVPDAGADATATRPPRPLGAAPEGARGASPAPRRSGLRRAASSSSALATVQPFRDRRPPLPIPAVERHRRPLTDDPQPLAHRLEQPPIVRHDQQRRGRVRHERLDRLARRDVEVVRRLVEEQQVRRPGSRAAPARAATARRPTASGPP